MGLRNAIIFPGRVGSYSYEAALLLLKQNSSLSVENSTHTVFTFKEVVSKVSEEEYELGVVPVENSLAGSVYESYDLLRIFPIIVIGEILLPISHCSCGVPEVDIELIDTIISHPKAFEQCKNFIQAIDEKCALRGTKLSLEIANDTASGALTVSKNNTKNAIAFCSELAANTYNLKVLQKDVQDAKDNITRFFIITSRKNVTTYTIPKNRNQLKGVLMFTLEHIPNSLVQALSSLNKNFSTVNIEKIESRPLKGTLFEYEFILECSFEGDRQSLELVIASFKEQVKTLTVLGVY